MSLLLIALYSSAAHAQRYATDRTSFILGGAVSVSSQNIPQVPGDDLRYTSILVNPRIEYFVWPGLALGGSATLFHTRFDGDSDTTYGVGPTVSYFFGRGERTLYPYLSAGTSYLTARGAESGALDYGGSAGLLFMLTRAVGLNGAVSYQIQTGTGEDSGDPSIHTIGLALGVSAFVF